MKCDEFNSLVNSVFDGEVPVETIAMATAHAEQCVHCSAAKDRITSLHERTIRLAEAVAIPPDLEGRIKAALQTESREGQKQTSVLSFKGRDAFAVAAAVICLVAVAVYVYSTLPHEGNLKVAKAGDEKIASNELKAKPVNDKSDKQKVEEGVLAHPNVSALDLANHTKDHVVDEFNYSPKLLPQLAQDAGFTLEPPSLPGWRLGDICICSVGTEQQPVAHMTYTRTTAGKVETVCCYQTLKGSFTKAGVPWQKSRGTKPVWTSDYRKFAIAFASNGPSSGNLENIFVGKMSAARLAEMVSHS